MDNPEKVATPRHRTKTNKTQYVLNTIIQIYIVIPDLYEKRTVSLNLFIFGVS